MLKKQLSPPTITRKTTKIDFLNSTRSMVNLTLDEKGARLSPVFFVDDIDLPLNLRVKKLFNVSGSLYLYCNDNKLYKKVDGSLLECSLEEFEDDLKVVEIRYEGQKRILAISPEKQIVCGTNEVNVNVPYGDFYAVYKGMLLCGKDREIKFSREYDYTDFSMGIDHIGSVMMDANQGNVCAFCVLRDKLYVVCEHSILLFTTYGETTDYTLKTIKTPYLNIKKQTVAFNNQVAYFINDGRLCVFDGQTIKTLASVLDKGQVVADGEGICNNGKYLLRVKISGQDGDYLFVYSGENGSRSIIEISGELSSGGENLADNVRGKILRLDSDSEQRNFAIDVEEGNLNSLIKKSLLNITVYSNSQARVTVKGDFGERRFRIERGLNSIPLNLTSYMFAIKITGNSNQALLQDLTLTYVNRGTR